MTIYFDAWLDENPLSRLKLAKVERADVVVASHGHNDHIGDSFALAKKREQSSWAITNCV